MRTHWCLALASLIVALPAHATDLIAPVARVDFGSPVQVSRGAADAAGNIYLVGTRLVEGLPEPPYQARSVFVAKFDAKGTSVYAVSIGGKGNDYGLAIAPDRDGNAFVVGRTSSPDFPVRNAVQDSAFLVGGRTSGFVMKLASDGTLAWSTFLGGGPFSPGERGSSINAVAVDDLGNAYVTGQTDSQGLLVTPGAFQTRGGGTAFLPQETAFVAKFSPTGALQYSTYLGGIQTNCYGGGSCSLVEKSETGTDIAVDSSGNVFITGYSNAVDFPTTPGAAGCSTSGDFLIRGDAPTVPFAVKMNPTGSALVYGTHICGTRQRGEGAPTANALTIDLQGNAYVVGTAPNSGFPTTTGALQTMLSGVADGFITKLDAAGNPVFSTLLGGSGRDSITSIRTSSDGTMVVAGSTNSPDFPDTTHVFPNGATFVTRLDSQASRVLSSVRFPAGITDAGILSSAGSALLVAGTSGLVSQLDLNGSPSTTALGAGNAATAGIQSAVPLGEVISIYGIGIGPAEAASVPAVNGSMPTTWNGVTVMMDGRPAPLLYVSANQINAIAFHFQPTTVQILRNDVETGSFRLGIRASDPQIFRHADGTGIAVNQDGTFNSADNPAQSGSIVAVWGTGLTSLCPDLLPGTIAAGARNHPGVVQIVGGPSPLQPPQYAGCAPGAVAAVFQINFMIGSGNGLITYTAGLAGAVIAFGSESFSIWIAP